MLDSEYAAPTTLAEAVALLREPGVEARVLAGGTDLLVQMRTGRRRPQRLVDVKRIAELMRLALGPDEAWIGAAVCGAALAEEPELARRWPGLAEAAALIGSDQIQGRASVGGNLCNASPAADTVPALLVNQAECQVEGPAGRRLLPAAEFCTGPGANALAPGELLVALRLPAQPERSADAYLRLIPRSEMDIAVAGAAVWLALEPDGRCRDARVAIGAVGPRALAVPDAAAALRGSRLEPAALDTAARAASAAAQPIDDVRGTVAYRRHVVGVLVKRAALRAAARARGEHVPAAGTGAEAR